MRHRTSNRKLKEARKLKQETEKETLQHNVAAVYGSHLQRTMAAVFGSHLQRTMAAAFGSHPLNQGLQ